MSHHSYLVAPPFSPLTLASLPGFNRVVTDPTLAALCRLWRLRQSKWDGLPHLHRVILGSPFVPLVATERDNVPSLLSDPSRSGRDSIPGRFFFGNPLVIRGIFRLNRVVESKKFVTRAIRCIEKVCTNSSLLKERSQRALVWNLQQSFQNTSYLPEEAQQLLFRTSVRHITSVEIPIGRFPAPVGCSLALAKDPYRLVVALPWQKIPNFGPWIRKIFQSWEASRQYDLLLPHHFR